MPIYCWKDLNTEFKVMVVRSINEHDRKPEEDELEEEERGKKRDWQLQIGTGIQMRKSAAWGSGKGRWIYLIAAIGEVLHGNPWIC